MTFDRDLFANKLRKYRDQFQLSDTELADRSGLSATRIEALCAGSAVPTGDEVLIMSDVFHCDYKFFVSADRIAPFERTEELFRRHGNDLPREDRWAIQEFLYLCECESFLSDALGRAAAAPFTFRPHGTYFKGHGAQAAVAFRQHMGLDANADITDVFALLRRAGLHVFRRALTNASISGLFVDHPTAGPCVLVNYSEDVWRQRFTALHEACHAYLDRNEHVVVSFTKWDGRDLKEIRADTFAAHVLLPDALMDRLPRGEWTAAQVASTARRLKVNHEPLIFRLRDTGRISEGRVDELKQTGRVGTEAKSDPELSMALTTVQAGRRLALLRRGLSSHFVSLCFDALDEGVISRGRLGEMLLVPDAEVDEVAAMFGRQVT